MSRLAFPLPPIAPLFSDTLRLSPSTSSNSAQSSRAFPSSNKPVARERVSSYDSAMSDPVSGEELWAEALSACEVGPSSSRDRRPSSSSTSSGASSSAFSADLSTAPTSRAGSGGDEDLLESLGRGALLLEQLEAQRKQPQSPPRRRQRASAFPDVVASNFTWSPPAGSPIAGPSTYQRTRRQLDFPAVKPSPSISTLRSTTTVSPDHTRNASFTRTDIAELDIESILDAYGQDWDHDALEVSAPVLERTPRPRATSNKTAYFPSAPTRTKSISSAKSAPSVRRELIFPSPAKSNVQVDRTVPSLPRHPSEIPSAPYADMFPRHRVSPFPTKKKSTSSLRSHPSTFPSAPPPLPAASLPLPTSPRYLSAPASPPSSREQAFPGPRRQSSVYSADSAQASARYSQYSSASSSATGSFRWSTVSGSTNASSSLAEESDSNWGGSRRGSVAASSCRSVGSVGSSRRPSVAASLRSSKSTRALRPLEEKVDWTTFAEELEEDEQEDGDDEQGSSGDERRRRPALKSNKSAPSARSLHRARSFKGSLYSSNYSSAADHEIPAVPALPKKVSLLSLRHLRSTTSLAGSPPPIPSRSGSLHKSAMSRAREQQ